MYTPDKDVPPPKGSYARLVCRKGPDIQGEIDRPYWDVGARWAMLGCQRALNRGLFESFAFWSKRDYPVDIDSAVG